MQRAKRVHKPGSSKTTPTTESAKASDARTGENLDFLAQEALPPEPYSPAQVMMLQRQLGNQATQNIIQGKPVRHSVPAAFLQRDTPAAVTIDDDYEDSESYSESAEDERDVPMAYDDEEVSAPDVETLREEMADLKYFGLVDKYGWGPVNELCFHLIDVLIDEGEMALADHELAVIEHRLLVKNLHADKKAQIVEASPTIAAKIEAGKAADRMSDYNHVMDLLRTDYMSDFQAGYLLLAKRYYYNPPEDFPYTDELKTLVETDTWSWLLTDEMQTRADAMRLFAAKRELEESQKDADATGIDPIEAITGGSVKAAGGISQMITVAEGVDILSQIDSDTKGRDLVTDGLEGLFERLVAKIFAPIAIGYDLIKAYKYHKTRRDGYSAAMDRSGIDKDGHTDVKPDTPDNIEKIRLGNVAYYAYKKTRRAMWGSIVNMALKLVKWISYAITVLSGGTTAVVTGAIALSADITRALMGISTKLKGFWKAVTGRRGAMRKKNASELMGLALKGNDDALQTIWDVNPFDEIKGYTKDAWNATSGLGIFASVTKVPKPESYEAFKESIKSGYYSTGKGQSALTSALKNTMSST